MALGTATVANRANAGANTIFMDVISCAGDTSYTTGGTAAFEAYVIAALGKGARDVVAILPLDCGLFKPVYDYTANTLKVYTEANVEVANATNLSTTTFRMLVISK
jgi:hypothetical protein